MVRAEGPLRVWFWQNIPSPHVAGLASGLAERGHEVVFVSSGPLGADRRQQGWVAGNPAPAAACTVAGLADMERLFRSAPPDTIHVTQGVRGNPLLGWAAGAGGAHARVWILTEEFDLRGLVGRVRRWLYAARFRLVAGRIEGALACGDAIRAEMLAATGGRCRVHPFTYFLPSPPPLPPGDDPAARVFRFVSVGQMIPRKRFNLAIEALARMTGRAFEFWLVGDGPLRPQLVDQASRQIGPAASWKGVVPMPDIPGLLAQCDCLILSSDFDGWGAVVNEALQSGTRVIVSNHCGSRALLKGLPDCDVFEAGSISSLAQACERQLSLGVLSPQARSRRARWADGAISARAGARYLEAILQGSRASSLAPPVPWQALPEGLAEVEHTP